jgi:hypothetical protein
MSQIGAVALRFAMALVKEQSKHPTQCFHCNYILNGMEKEGSVILIHDEKCEMLAAVMLVSEYNREISGQCINAMA